MLKTFPTNKIHVTKNVLFLLLRAPPHRSFTFNSPFLRELKYKARLFKSMLSIFHFRFGLVFIKI